MKIHIVQKGDTLWNIAKKYNVDFHALKSLNSQLSNPDMIYPGMKIKIPGSAAAVQPNSSDKEQPVKEQPMYPKEENVQMIETSHIQTYPTHIQQDIYQVDMLTVVNEKEQPQMTAKPKPMPKFTQISASQPAAPLIKPAALSAEKKEQPKAVCEAVTEQPVQSTQGCPSAVSQEAGCPMMIPTQIPCMPYPFFVPCLPMPAPSCSVYMLQQPHLSYGVPPYMPSVCTHSDCTCSVDQSSAVPPAMNHSYAVPMDPVSVNCGAANNLYG